MWLDNNKKYFVLSKSYYFSLKQMLKVGTISANYCSSCCIRHSSQLGQCKIRSPLSAKKKRLKCAHPGREMLLIYCMSPKVTELWKSGLCGCFRLTLTQLNCPFIFFKKTLHRHSISQTDAVPPKLEMVLVKYCFYFVASKKRDWLNSW